MVIKLSMLLFNGIFISGVTTRASTHASEVSWGRDTDGRYRSRLVTKGFSQVEGIDFDELFSPVVRYKTARLLFAVATLEDWDIQSVDVKTAYLYGDLDEEIYIEQPEGFRLPVTKK